jgi:hypothetical protein
VHKFPDVNIPAITLYQELSNNATRYASMEPLQAITAGVLCSLSLQYPRPVRSDYIRDLIAILTCLALHLRKPATLSLSLSIAYVVWTLLPGSFNSLTLPSYATFKRTTTLIQPNNDASDPTECAVCWDTAHALVRLPCNHYCCPGCLQLMNEHFHTACPMCRRPLFSSHDRAIFTTTKVSVTCGAVNAILHLLTCMHEVRSGQFYSAAFSLAFSCAIARYLWHIRVLVQAFGENWWRGGATTTSGLTTMSLQRAGLALVTGVGLLCQTLWTSRACFG